MQSKMLFCRLIAFILFFSNSLFSQVENSDAKVLLSLSNDKKVYQIGEPLNLILTFTAQKDGFVMNKAGSQKLEEIWVKAIDSDEWKTPFKTFDREHTFAFANVKLSETPSTFNIKLNTVKGFPKVGKYLLKIETKRVSILEKPPTDNRFLTGGKYFPLTTNTVEIEVKEMSQDVEKEEITRLMALLESEKDWDKKEGYAQDISFLRGDASTIFKVSNFLNPRDYSANFGHHNYTGLMLSQNKSLAVKLLEDAFYDLNREVRMNIIWAAAQLRILQEFGDSTGNSEQRKVRSREITQNYVNQLFESLPNRKGKSLTTAAVTLFQQLPKEDISSNVFNTTKAIILNNFDELNPYDQNHLLEHYWEKLKTPSLIPSLEKILSREKPVQFLDNRVPVKRLIELNKMNAKPFVIKEICNPDSVIGVDDLALLNDQYIPEVDNCLLDQIRQSGQPGKKFNSIYLRIKSLLAARYATKGIYSDLMNLYKESGNKWYRDAQAAILGYFARYDDKEAMVLVEERLKSIKESRATNFFYDLARVNFTKGMEKLLQNQFNDSDNGDVEGAAYYLSKYGGKENRKLIENRYKLWLKEWQSRKDEFDNDNADKIIQRQRMFQITFVQALKDAKAWKLTEKEVVKLKESCYSEMCRRYFIKY